MLFMLLWQRPTSFFFLTASKQFWKCRDEFLDWKTWKMSLCQWQTHWWGQWTHLKRLQRIQVSTEGLLSCMQFFLWQGTNEGFRVHGCCLILSRKKFQRCWAIAEISQSHSITRHNDLWKWEKHVSLPSSKTPTKEFYSGYYRGKANHS